MGLGIQAGFAVKKISEYSEFKNYKTVMEFGCQTISKTSYPLLKKHIFPNNCGLTTLNSGFRGGPDALDS